MKKKCKIENVNLIRKIAWSFHKSTGVSFDDLFQEGYIAYVNALETYNPANGMLSTYIWYCISNHLKNHLKTHENASKHEMDLEQAENFESPDAFGFWNTLSGDAKEIANIVLKAPKEFIYNSFEVTERRLTNLLKNRGWKERRINVAISDLKTACQ